jgi:hypothetical protein
MKKLLYISILFTTFLSFAQDHFSGINTSSRVGILNASLNPAELPNLSKKFEFNIYGLSFNVANNKVGFSDLTSDTNLEDLIFKGADPVNMRFDGQIIGPSMAMKWKKWGFGITTKANVKFDLVDIDTKIGDAIANSGSNIIGSTIINNNYNQRMNGTSWGEVGLSAGRTVFENEKHRFNAGITFKFLFPGSYANLGLDKFQGTIDNSLGSAYLNNTTANLNIAYSGNLANSFTNSDDYTKSIFGSLNGVATDIGINYQWKAGDKKYKINAGVSVRNIGSMTFKDDNNLSTNYKLNIPDGTLAEPGLDLSVFEDVESLQDVETILQDSGYLTTVKSNKNFKVKLPTVFSVYADVKLIAKLSVTLFTQQKLNSDNNNDQITTQNIISVTPRVNLGFFETYLPVSNNEVSGTNVGIGFRLGGFYIGSSSVITTVLNDSKQADFYTGFRWAFL